MQTLSLPGTSRFQCLCQLRRSLRTGSLTMDREMADILGITIDAIGGAEHTTRPLPAAPISSESTSPVFIDSVDVAAGLYDSMSAFSSQGVSKLSEWPDSYRMWDPYWGFGAVMTTEDPAAALAITVHSHTASESEMLTSEFIACYLVADVAWQNEDIRKDFENTAQTQQRLHRQDIESGPQSALPSLPIRIISIHGRNIRVLNATFTEQYYRSFSKASQTSPSSLRVSIQSFPPLGYDDAHTDQMARKLMNT